MAATLTFCVAVADGLQALEGLTPGHLFVVFGLLILGAASGVLVLLVLILVWRLQQGYGGRDVIHGRKLVTERRFPIGAGGIVEHGGGTVHETGCLSHLAGRLGEGRRCGTFLTRVDGGRCGIGLLGQRSRDGVGGFRMAALPLGNRTGWRLRAG